MTAGRFLAIGDFVFMENLYGNAIAEVLFVNENSACVIFETGGIRQLNRNTVNGEATLFPDNRIAPYTLWTVLPK